MLVVISPAKRLDLTPASGATATEPAFQREANILAGHVRQMPLSRLKGLMDLSDDLARLNRDRFRDFEDRSTPTNSKPAVLAFAGDTYLGLEAGSLDAETMERAQRRLRILSGLYGVLRPLDAIQPYRLEMGSRLKTRRGGDLYRFWGDIPAKALNEAAAETGSDVLLNCASQEYFGAVDLSKLELRVISPRFLEIRNGEPRIVSFFAKKARGSMARFVLERDVTDPEGLKDFDLGGYVFDPELSSPDSPAFLRGEPRSDGHSRQAH